jgi:hypothetical protein
MKLLGVLREPVVREGKWHLLECIPAWEGTWTGNCSSRSLGRTKKVSGVWSQ